MIYVNCQGLTTNFPKLEILVSKCKPNLIFVSETHLTDVIEDCEIQLSNYNHVRCDSNSRHTGGVIIYLKSNLEYNVHHSEVFSENNTWFLSVKVRKGIKKGLYSILYHSPNSSDTSFLDFFERMVETVLDEYENNILVGDFNINLLRTNNNTKRLSNIITMSGMKQLVKYPTRVTNTSSTMIDLVVSIK